MISILKAVRYFVLHQQGDSKVRVAFWLRAILPLLKLPPGVYKHKLEMHKELCMRGYENLCLPINHTHTKPYLLNLHTFNEFFDSLWLHRVTGLGCFLCFASTNITLHALACSVGSVPAVLLDQRDYELFGLLGWFWTAAQREVSEVAVRAFKTRFTFCG